MSVEEVNCEKGMSTVLLSACILVALVCSISHAQDEDNEPITSGDCITCHWTSDHDTDIAEDLSHSIHDGFECLDCHLLGCDQGHVLVR